MARPFSARASQGGLSNAPNDSSSRPQDESTEPLQPPRKSSYSIPRGFDKLLHHEPESLPSPQPRRPSSQNRYHLHVRQHPVAARACGAGDRDRRPIDPPPIVQILLSDFDSALQEDRDILQDPRFTVGCLLIPVAESTSVPNSAEGSNSQHAGHDIDGLLSADESPSTPLLSGKAFMSPFYVDADPDPNSAPNHPRSTSDTSSRVCPLGEHEFSESHINTSNASKLNQPATFFIFADLSIRSAGLYRLQFRLMNWGSVEDTGQSMPILAEVWSDPFRVYAAKDFPGMRDSSILVEGLKELGFVELKTRGKGKGKGRKRL
ncbi:Sexual development regulator velC [Penicillium diatomitis]|uniref:Sexual development regulator velC n=1 Tax=Penicillium diatomitis TaxID=2819901 RepID=A0A9W9WVI1_9EURO|nr:Sexual development regulator velC [Penicillium diatomitis]KAJ5477310.1 Sexual development regulator velC [Penicillium diatomitis]